MKFSLLKVSLPLTLRPLKMLVSKYASARNGTFAVLILLGCRLLYSSKGRIEILSKMRLRNKKV